MAIKSIGSLGDVMSDTPYVIVLEPPSEFEFRPCGNRLCDRMLDTSPEKLLQALRDFPQWGCRSRSSYTASQVPGLQNATALAAVLSEFRSSDLAPLMPTLGTKETGKKPEDCFSVRVVRSGDNPGSVLDSEAQISPKELSHRDIGPCAVCN